MKYNSNFNFGVENEIVCYVSIYETKWIMLTIYYI